MIAQLFRRKVQISIAAASLTLFLLIALDIFFEGTLFQFDALVHQWSLTWHTPLGDRLMHGITQLGNLSTMLLYLLVLTLYFLWKGEKRVLSLLWASMVGGVVLFGLIKELFMRARPSNYIGDIHQHGYSFPSGHATMSMVFALSLFYLFYSRTEGVWRVVLLAFLFLFPLLVAFSRVYLEVHYFTDVMGGWVLGIFWVTLMVLTFSPSSRATTP